MRVFNDKINIINYPSSAGNTPGYGQPIWGRLTMSILSFDPDKFYLGKICANGHEWELTGKTLRRRADSACPECQRVRYLKKIQEDPDFNKKRYQRSREYNIEYQRKYRQEYPEVVSQRNKEHRKQNREKLITYSREYYEQNRNDLLPKARKYHKQYYLNNREEINEKHREYYYQNRQAALLRSRKRRAKKKTVHYVKYSPVEIKLLKEKFDNCCAYCGTKSALALDHFLPINQGGSDCLGNLVPICKSCNSSKHDSDPLRWYKSQSFYSEKRWRKILKVLGKTEKTYNQLPLL